MLWPGPHVTCLPGQCFCEECVPFEIRALLYLLFSVLCVAPCPGQRVPHSGGGIFSDQNTKEFLFDSVCTRYMDKWAALEMTTQRVRLKTEASSLFFSPNGTADDRVEGECKGEGGRRRKMV